MNEIAGSAQNQTLSLQQVNTAIGDMNGVTQQNASMAQDVNSATGSLSAEASHVVELVNQFDLGRSGEVPSPDAITGPRAPRELRGHKMRRSA
jgi:methyl-accepting chemotaxis protein